MASHGVARTSRIQTAEQKAQDTEKIARYRSLEDEIRGHVINKTLTPEHFPLTTKLLKLNPEYYTIWNVRRRLLISGLLSKRLDGSWPSKASQTSSPIGTITHSSEESFSSSLTETLPAREYQTAGRNGTIAEVGARTEEFIASRDATSDTKQDEASAKSTGNDFAVLQSELNFIVPLLQEWPKCYWIWNHRSWILQQAMKRLDVSRARGLWEMELVLDSKMLTKDRRNFHAWAYRRLVVEKLESPELNGQSMVESEFEYTSRMIRVDLSNFSAWHNRSKLIPRLLLERHADDAARQTFFEQEIGLIREALNVGPEDQSLWYYHHFLMLNLFEPVGRATITPGFTLEDRVTYVERELEAMSELLEDYDDVKWIYEALLESTIALADMEDRQLREEEKDALKQWLEKLKALDPLRNGRWVQVERAHGLL